MVKNVSKVVVNNKEDKTDCFAWITKVKCDILKRKECKNCSFYKNKNDALNHNKNLLKK